MWRVLDIDKSSMLLSHFSAVSVRLKTRQELFILYAIINLDAFNIMYFEILFIFTVTVLQNLVEVIHA